MNNTRNQAEINVASSNSATKINTPSAFQTNPAHPTPPNNLDAEQSLLGAVLLDCKILPDLLEIIAIDDFYRALHRTILSGIIAVNATGAPVDFVTLCEHLRRKDKLEEIGGSAYIGALREACPSSANWNAYAEIVRDLSLKRQAARLAVSATDYAMNGVPAGEAIIELRRSLESLEIKNAPRRVTQFTGEEILGLELPEPNWVVPGLLPEGLSILAGNPKLGKSWLSLGIAIATATGGAVLGNIKVERGDVLYLALEDTTRRLQNRIRKVFGAGAPDGVKPSEHAALSRLSLATEWPAMDAGGITKLERWLLEHPNARLVVIDTFQKIRGNANASNSNAYAGDYEAVAGLKLLADRHGLAFLLVHHRKKGLGMDDLESISGSYGLTGAADGIWSLKRERGRADATLFVTGRDVDEQELALKWDAALGSWATMGEASEYRLSQERAEVLTALRAAGRPLTPKELHDERGLGKSHGTLKHLLWEMSKDGQLRNDSGRYSPADSPAPTAATSPQTLPTLGDLPEDDHTTPALYN